MDIKNMKTASKAKKHILTEAEKARKTRGQRVLEKKPYLELITALLSIPVLITVIILNFTNLKNLGKPAVTPTPAANAGYGGNNGNFFAAPINRQPRPTAPALTQEACNKSLGPISITSPSEGDTVADNPVEVNITYDDSTYCQAVWSYRINGGGWSSYDNNSIALYNLPQGAVKIELRVKSLASSDQTTLTRNFTYNGQNTSVNPTASGSAQ
jgi:hypothetical protein